MKKAKKKPLDAPVITVRTFLEPALYLLPFLVIIGVFMVYPVMNVFISSFMENYDYVAGEYTGMGFGNFKELFSDPYFISSLKNTFIYVGCVVPASTLLALITAILLNQKIRFSPFFQFAYFLPMVTAVIAVGLVWKWMYNSDYGLINVFIKFFGGDPVNWLNNPKTAMAALVIYGIWNKLPFTIILFLSGLQAIDKQYYTAAQIDGAKNLLTFFRITLPLLSPTFALVMIINIINTSKVFNEVYALFNGKPGPAYSLYTVVFYIFDNFYNKWEVAAACAAALVLFLIVFLMTLFQMQIQKRWNYL